MERRARRTSGPDGTGGISDSNRHRLQVLHQRAAGPFSPADAAEWLDISQPAARRFLSYLADRGWLARVRRGLYVPVPLEARQPGEWTADPWVVAHRSFAPCYLGGWSACEHWGLTDQTFRQIIVVTARRVRHRRVEIQGTPYRLKVVAQEKLFGTRPVWRGRVRVDVSDPSRTLVDLLDDPGLGGGMRTVADVAREYFAGPHRDDERLLDYTERVGNRTVYKRLGYLVEALQIDAHDLVLACLDRQSAGISALDPSVNARGHTVSRWHLRINVALDTPE